jgi:hypothetical protein
MYEVYMNLPSDISLFVYRTQLKKFDEHVLVRAVSVRPTKQKHSVKK